MKASVHGVSGKKNLVRQQRPLSSQQNNSGFYSSVAFLMQAYKWLCVERVKVVMANKPKGEETKSDSLGYSLTHQFPITFLLFCPCRTVCRLF